jgi:2-polyprenyl-6-methoxyphenol hydroxylase-like FAD-dependent oxidoreductase
MDPAIGMMADRPLSIAICGAGPAGLAAALLLHRDGHRVRLFERFDTPRPVGSGLLLQPTGLAVLAQLGIAGPLIARGARISRLHGVSSGRRTALNVRYHALGPHWSAIGVHRAALFDALHTAVQAEGIPVECGVTLVQEDRRLAGFDLVVDALGARSALSPRRRRELEFGALWVNLPWPGASFHQDRLEQRYRGAACMAGLMPIGWVDSPQCEQAAFFWSLRRGDHAAWHAAPLAAWHDQVAGLWPEMAEPLHAVAGHDACTFATYEHFTRRQPYEGNRVQIGDAAHATSPQLGQGANMALLDALALAVALRSATSLPDALPRYARMRRWHVRLFQLASAVFTPFYQSDSRVLPLLRDHLLAPLTCFWPGNRIVAQLVAGMTVAPLRGTGFRPLRLDQPL